MIRLPILALLAIAATLGGCRSTQPLIVFTKVPSAAEGTPFKLDSIEGRAIGAQPGQQIVIYAKSRVWWVQPFVGRSSTAIQADSTWRGSTHPGTDYAALLVGADFTPPATTQELPAKGGSVFAVATVKGAGPQPVTPVPKLLRFSSYDWEVRSQPSDRGGKRTNCDPANAWTDDRGFLHLRLTPDADGWAGAEVRLTHSLGQGSYLFIVRDVSHLDPAAAFTMFTWDDLAADQHHREVDVEVSRWGNPSSKNAQFVVQPFDEPANVVRFEAPPGPLIFSFRWEPGRVSFKTARGSSAIAGHEFTSGVPSPGGESVSINLYAFGNSKIPPRSGSEVVIEKFEFLP
jgi:hypothetical protein